LPFLLRPGIQQTPRAGWSYDINSPSPSGAFPRALYEFSDNATFATADTTNGVALCGIALSSYTAAGTATITGTSATGASVTAAMAGIPAYPAAVIVVLDSTWQAATSLTITQQVSLSMHARSPTPRPLCLQKSRVTFGCCCSTKPAGPPPPLTVLLPEDACSYAADSCC
jgi:hypothetical protein